MHQTFEEKKLRVIGVTDTSEWPLTTDKSKYYNLWKMIKVKIYKPKKYLTATLSNILNEFLHFGKFKP